MHTVSQVDQQISDAIKFVFLEAVRFDCLYGSRDFYMGNNFQTFLRNYAYDDKISVRYHAAKGRMGITYNGETTARIRGKKGGFFFSETTMRIFGFKLASLRLSHRNDGKQSIIEWKFRLAQTSKIGPNLAHQFLDTHEALILYESDERWTIPVERNARSEVKLVKVTACPISGVPNHNELLPICWTASGVV